MGVMGSGDIGNVLYAKCSEAFAGVEIYRSEDEPEGVVASDRIVIYTKPVQLGGLWNSGYVEVNFCVPNRQDGAADLNKLQEYERQALQMLGGNGHPVVGEYGENFYRYRVSTTSTEQDEPLNCHFVNAHILFEILNTLN